MLTGGRSGDQSLSPHFVKRRWLIVVSTLCPSRHVEYLTGRIGFPGLQHNYFWGTRLAGQYGAMRLDPVPSNKFRKPLIHRPKFGTVGTNFPG
jgi:hypothetical protein